MRAAAILIALAALGQGAEPGSATIQGQVLAHDTRAPIDAARIVAAKVGGALSDYRTTSSDQAGRFVFAGLSTGSYRIYAQRDGFLQAEYGRHPVSTEGTAVVVSAREGVSGITILMTPPGVIAGRVFESGRPLRNAWVRALKARFIDGERILTIVDRVQTDDRGEYRLSDLAPGAYLVSATAPDRSRVEGDVLVTPVIPSNANNNRRETRTALSFDDVPVDALDRSVYPTVYYPGTTGLEGARRIDVGERSVVNGIDLTLAAVATFSVKGRVVWPEGTPESSSRADVTASPMALPPARPGFGVLRSSGVRDVFELAALVPGRYWVAAQTAESAGRMAGAVAVDVVDRDVQGVEVVLQKPVTVRGRVTVDGRPRTPDDPSFAVQLTGGNERGLLGVGLAPVQPDGTFSFPNVSPRDYGLRTVVQGGQSAWVRSMRFGAEDVSSAPIRIAAGSSAQELQVDVSFQTASLDATVRDGEGRVMAGVIVVTVPDAARRSRSSLFRSTTTDAAGHLVINGIPPGEYRVFASATVAENEWQDPEVLAVYEVLGQVTRFAAGDRRTVTLRVTP